MRYRPKAAHPWCQRVHAEALEAGSELERLFAGQLRMLGVPEPVREFRFAPPRRWRFDFAFPWCRIAAEVEGATFSGGRHTRGAGFAKDCEKYNAAMIRGWQVYRFDALAVKRGTAAAMIEQALAAWCENESGHHSRKRGQEVEMTDDSKSDRNRDNQPAEVRSAGVQH